MSSAHSIACVPSGVSKVTVYRARTEPRAILAPAVRRAATRTGARTAVAEETVKADAVRVSLGVRSFERDRSIETRGARRARGGGVGIRVLSI